MKSLALLFVGLLALAMADSGVELVVRAVESLL